MFWFGVCGPGLIVMSVGVLGVLVWVCIWLWCFVVGCGFVVDWWLPFLCSLLFGLLFGAGLFGGLLVVRGSGGLLLLVAWWVFGFASCGRVGTTRLWFYVFGVVECLVWQMLLVRCELSLWVLDSVGALHRCFAIGELICFTFYV